MNNICLNIYLYGCIPGIIVWMIAIGCTLHRDEDFANYVMGMLIAVVFGAAWPLSLPVLMLGIVVWMAKQSLSR